MPRSPNAATVVHSVFPSTSLRPPEPASLRNVHQSRSAAPFLSPAIIRESRWRFSLFLSSWPFLDTASGEIPAFCTRRSFCFLRNHPKNFARDARPKLKLFCDLKHQMSATGSIGWPEYDRSAVFSSRLMRLRVATKNDEMAESAKWKHPVAAGTRR